MYLLKINMSNVFQNQKEKIYLHVGFLKHPLVEFLNNKKEKFNKKREEKSVDNGTFWVK